MTLEYLIQAARAWPPNPMAVMMLAETVMQIGEFQKVMEEHKHGANCVLCEQPKPKKPVKHSKIRKRRE